MITRLFPNFLKAGIVLIAIFGFFVPVTAQQPATLNFIDADATSGSANVVNLTWELNRAPTSSEPMRLTIYTGGNNVYTELIGTKKTGAHNLRGNVGDTFRLEMRNTRTNVVSPTTEIRVTTPSNTGGSSGGEFQFRDTLFGNVSAQQYIRSLYIWSVGIAILGASIMMIYAGYKYTTSRGNPTELSNAKEIIISSLVGLTLLLLSFTILRFLGVNVRNAVSGSSSNQNQTQSQSQMQQNVAPANVNPPVDPNNQLQR